MTAKLLKFSCAKMTNNNGHTFHCQHSLDADVSVLTTAGVKMAPSSHMV